jgi:ubiquinone/menaquinone biosynthesis C-methylase UbiE
MNADLQRRIQRYGWDRAADLYEPLWQAQLADVRAAVMEFATLAPGEQVLDVASGTGLVTFEAARAGRPHEFPEKCRQHAEQRE